jgi:hypothetical protein
MLNDNSKVIPRADEFTDKQLEEFARNYRLVCLIESGSSPRKALERLATEYPDMKHTERWAQKIYKRYKENGTSALIDHRFHRKPAPYVLTDTVKDLILKWWYARPAAGPRAIWKKVVDECEELEIRPPGEDTVKRFLASRPQHDKLVRAGKIKIWDKEFRPVVRFDLTTYSNERWQIDHTRLDIWIRVKVGDHWEPREVWCTAALDAESRSIPGFLVSIKHPDAWTTALLIRHAVLPKELEGWKNRGLPAVLQPDRGKDFMSHAVATSLGYLGIHLDPDPPYYPNRKGRIERWFLTLDRGCLRILPGHMDAIGRSRTAAEKHVSTLLTWSQLRAEIENWIVKDYHQRIHSETGRRPTELWEETVRLRMPECEDALNNMLLKSDKTRVVQRIGVVFRVDNIGGAYWAPPLADFCKSEVRIRYNPEDLDSILVYCALTGDFICEAWLMGQETSRYNITDVKRERSRYRRGLQERMKDYAREIELKDRRSARQAEWDEARLLADSHEADTLGSIMVDAISEDSKKIEALIAEFERHDRGQN